MKRFLLFFILPSILLASFYQVYCYLKMASSDLRADLFLGFGAIFLLVLDSFLFLRKIKSGTKLVTILFLLFLPMKFYYIAGSSFQMDIAFTKGNKIIDDVRAYEAKHRHFPASLYELNGVDTFYYVGFVRYPYAYLPDSASEFQLSFKISGSRAFVFFGKTRRWNLADFIRLESD